MQMLAWHASGALRLAIRGSVAIVGVAVILLSPSASDAAYILGKCILTKTNGEQVVINLQHSEWSNEQCVQDANRCAEEFGWSWTRIDFYSEPVAVDPPNECH